MSNNHRNSNKYPSEIKEAEKKKLKKFTRETIKGNKENKG